MLVGSVVAESDLVPPSMGTSPRRERELADLKRLVADPEITTLARAVMVLTIHQRREPGGCLCGWGRIGQSFSRHQAEALEEAGLLIASGSAPPVGG